MQAQEKETRSFSTGKFLYKPKPVTDKTDLSYMYQKATPEKTKKATKRATGKTKSKT